MSELEELQKQVEALQAMGKVTDRPEQTDEIVKQVAVDMDENDIIRLENILLKERNFELERQHTRSNFYAMLVDKYHIDISKYELAVDAQIKKIILIPK